MEEFATQRERSIPAGAHAPTRPAIRRRGGIACPARLLPGVSPDGTAWPGWFLAAVDFPRQLAGRTCMVRLGPAGVRLRCYPAFHADAEVGRGPWPPVVRLVAAPDYVLCDSGRSLRSRLHPTGARLQSVPVDGIRSLLFSDKPHTSLPGLFPNRGRHRCRRLGARSSGAGRKTGTALAPLGGRGTICL